MSNSSAEKAKRIVESNIYMTIATASTDAMPWITPVLCAYDSNYNFFWVSALDAVHSKLIQENDRVAIAIFDSHAIPGAVDGIYIIARAHELMDAELEHGCDVFYTRRYPDPEIRKDKGRHPKDFQGQSPRRMYAAVPERVFVLEPGGHPIYTGLIDTRIEVDLKDMRTGNQNA